MFKIAFGFIVTIVIIVLFVVTLFKNVKEIPPPKILTYYIAADELLWDYVPGSSDSKSWNNLITEMPFTASELSFIQKSPNTIGKWYFKTVYKQYTDETFATRTMDNGESEHLGILGPIIRAAVDDTIEIVFKNNGRFPASIHFPPSFEPILFEDSAIIQGEKYRYQWKVTKSAGPKQSEVSSNVWLYHSGTAEIADTNAGLIGPIIITRRENVKDVTRKPTIVQKELVVLFKVFDENKSPYLPYNVQKFTPKLVNTTDSDFVKSNKKHSVNGFVFGNLKGLEMNFGERVRLYLISVDTNETHTPYWRPHKNNQQQHLSSSMILDKISNYNSTIIMDVIPASEGVWILQSTVDQHNTNGMSAFVTLKWQRAKEEL